VSLRARLVGALGILLAVGLAVFGLVTYGFYARSQYRRLDDQLRASVPQVSRSLSEEAGLDGAAPVGNQAANPAAGGSGRPPVPPPVVPPSTYAELHLADGTVVKLPFDETTTAVPDIPADLPAPGEYFTVGSTSGSGKWRVYVAEAFRPAGATVVVAIPTTEVDSSLHRLLLIESLSAAALLAALGTGSWLVLRHGLRPLERMATSARSISAGDLSRRVSPADSKSEVGQLGEALNTMLGEIEGAFKEREATEQRLRQFLADASHELRTPLTSIQGFAELFRLGEGNPDLDLPTVLRRIEQESARMKSLVDDLLLLARVDQTRAARREAVDLTVVAADACSDAAAASSQHPVSLDAPEPVVVSGDNDHLRQAVANLVTNALRHTPPGSAVNVSTRVIDGAAVLVVRDHGPGLDAEALEHVFDRFWQADTARSGLGAGLGLSIVTAIAHEHGGTVAASNHVDGGAVFTLTLPLSAPARHALPVHMEGTTP